MNTRFVRIMVAEDDAVVARDIEETVTELGYTVCGVVGSGTAAVQTAKDDRPDLALLDIRMPGRLDGVGAGREIMRSFGIPVIFLTAYGDRDTVHRATSEGPFAYILKPFDARELGAAIEVALHRGELERRLRASEERFRQIAESIDDVFWISSLDKSHMDYVSPAFERIWGIPAERLLEEPGLWLERILPADRDRIASSLPLQAQGGWEREYRIVRPDGEIRWIMDRAFPVPPGEGEGDLSRIAGVAQDVTARREAEDRFGLLSEHIRDVVLVLDRDGRVTFTSPSIDEASGYAKDALQGSDIMDLVHPDDQASLRAELHDLAQHPDRTARTQCRIVTRTGEVRHMESIARNRLGHPGVNGIVMVSRDVTHRLALEERLREAAKMEAIGRLAAGVAHDFNNLLTVIRAQADLLMIDLDPPEPLREEIELIASTASRAADLTTQLLAFGRGQLLRPQVANLNELIEDMLPFLKKPLGSHTQIETAFSPELEPVRIDKSQFEQVILNLALNARDALPRGGRLRLATQMLPADAGAPRKVRLRVSDNGIGMDSATRQRIFEPFFTTKEGQGGTGLGLASSYGIVSQSGGTMHVESTVGEGTTFILDFPVASDEGDEREEPAREAPTEPEPHPRSGDTRTILVVEDDPHVRRVVERTLVRDGYRVTVVEDADSAIDALRQDPTRFIAVLSDLTLRGTSARALIDHVVSHYPGTPIITMSGYADGSPGSREDLPHSIPFIQKPFTPDGLRTTVRRVTRRALGA